MKPSQSKKINKAMKMKVVEVKVTPKKNKHSHPQLVAKKAKKKKDRNSKNNRDMSKATAKLWRKGRVENSTAYKSSRVVC